MDMKSCYGSCVEDLVTNCGVTGRWQHLLELRTSKGSQVTEGWGDHKLSPSSPALLSGSNVWAACSNVYSLSPHAPLPQAKGLRTEHLPTGSRDRPFLHVS